MFVGYIHVVYLDDYNESVRKMCRNSNEWEYRNTQCIVVHSFTVYRLLHVCIWNQFSLFLGRKMCLSAINPTVIKQLTEHSASVLNGMSA